MNYDLYCDVLVGEMDDVMFPVWSAQSEECISLSKKVLLMRVAHDLEDINRLTNDMFEDNIIFEALKLNAHFEDFAKRTEHGYSPSFARFAHNLVEKIDRYENNYSHFEISYDDIYGSCFAILNLYCNIAQSLNHQTDFSTLGQDVSYQQFIQAYHPYQALAIGDVTTLLQISSKKGALSRLGKILTKKDSRELKEEAASRLRELLEDYFVLVMSVTFMKFKTSLKDQRQYSVSSLLSG